MDAHPLADLFPMMGEAEFAAFADDIAERGLQQPIVILDGMILDGRNRARACRERNVWIETVDYEGNDPAGYIVSSNLHRRHLTQSQRAMVAAQITTFRLGDNQHTARPADLPAWKTAKLLGVSERLVKAAKAVISDCDSELLAAVRDGRCRVHAAVRLARLPRERRRSLLRHRQTRHHPSSAMYCRVAGSGVEGIRWTDLAGLIERADAEAAILRRIAGHASNVEPDRLVSDVIAPSDLRRLVEGWRP